MNEAETAHGKRVREIMLYGITRYIQEHGYSPTVREIGDMAGVKSTSSVHAHLKKMFEDGTLETDCEIGTPRAIRVPGYRFVKKARKENERSF